jgi:hypothetical protein
MTRVTERNAGEVAIVRRIQPIAVSHRICDDLANGEADALEGEIGESSSSRKLESGSFPLIDARKRRIQRLTDCARLHNSDALRPIPARAVGHRLN